MKKILQIESSIKSQNSFSNQLSALLLEKITAAHPDHQIKTRNLSETPLPHLTDAHFAAFLAAPETRTERQTVDVKVSDEAIAELMDADIIVLAVPFYNFGIPSTLKAWVDHIARAGITFRYDANGAEGLVKNKKVYLAIASGAVYSEGPMKGYDFAEPYMRAMLGFLGMTDITTIRVEGTSIPGVTETALSKAVDKINELALA